MGKFKHGMVLGGLLGAGLVWLNTTKKGREVREQILDHSAEVYTRVKDEIVKSDALEQLSKNEYVKKVQAAVDKYAVETGLAQTAKKTVKKIVSAQYDRLKRSEK